MGKQDLDPSSASDVFHSYNALRASGRSSARAAACTGPTAPAPRSASASASHPALEAQPPPSFSSVVEQLDLETLL